MFLVLELVSVHILFDILLVYFIQYIQYFYLTEIHIQMGGQNLFHNKRLMEMSLSAPSLGTRRE